MTDKEIRLYVHKMLPVYESWFRDPFEKVIRHEMPLFDSRVDIALIGQYMHGVEIKSERDTMKRLPSQIESYKKVFDYVLVVTEPKYREKVLEICPDWVSVWICHNENNGETIRHGRINIEKDGFSLCQLLWKEELINFIQRQGFRCDKKSTKWKLSEFCAKNVDLQTISDEVRSVLFSRYNPNKETEPYPLFNLKRLGAPFDSDKNQFTVTFRP